MIRGDAVGAERSWICVLVCLCMPPFPPLLWMDAGSASPPSSMVAGPSPLWRLAERRSRKAGSGNIFHNVNLWQLQRLFQAAGDQDAEQRAELIWGHRDEAELAQALIGLRARSHRRGQRTHGRDALGTHWLRAFNHLRIGEGLAGCQRKDPGEEAESAAGEHSPEPPHRHSSAEATATGVPSGSQSPTGTSERAARAGSGLRRVDKDPDRYLHRILH